MIWKRALLILTQPIKAWREIAREPNYWVLLLIGLVLPMSLITSFVIASGHDLPDDKLFISMLIYIATVIMSITLGSYMIWRLAPRFLSQGSYGMVVNLVSYSYIAVFLAFLISGIDSQLEVLKFFGLYSVYIYWKGLTYTLKTADDRKVGFTFISTLILTGIGYLVDNILKSMLF